MTTATMAAAAIFDQGSLSRPMRRHDVAVFTAACGMEQFTITDVAVAAGSPWLYFRAQPLLHLLWKEGHLRRVNTGRKRPIVYEWVEP